jgi:oligosaccharide translocation protein RFT1
MSILSTSAHGASLLILFQLFSRLFTFALNQLLLRYLSPSTLGLSSQLELFSITVLYFSRESIRVASQRSSNTQVVVNLGYVSILFGVLLSLGLGSAYAGIDTPRDIPYFKESLWIYALAAVVELVSEPGFLVAQQKLLFKVRAGAEGLGTVGRCVAACGVAVWGSRNGIKVGVLPFAAGQMVYAILVLGSYAWSLRGVGKTEKYSLMLAKIEGYVRFYICTGLTE